MLLEFRDGQRKQWNSAATGWRKWSELIDRAASGISERLVELAGVEPGSRVLDVAAGYGEPSLTAARTAGPEGSVVATDISAEMLAFGRERAAAAGLREHRVRRVRCRLARLPRGQLRRRALALGDHLRARRRGRPRPASAASSSPARGWRSAPGDRPSACRSWRFRCGPRCSGSTCRRRRRERPDRSRARRPEAIGGLLEGGGFSDVEVEEAEVTFEWQSPEEFTTFIREIAPPITAMIAPHPQEVQDETWAAITEAIRRGEHAKPAR